jgi:hypothetical protein
VHYESAPATTNIKKLLPPLEPEFPADQVELARLRLIERLLMRVEIRARVNHALIQPELVKIVADIVVMLD